MDFGDVGVDANGVFARLHPEILLAERPRLWGPVGRFRRGQRTITPEDESLSAFDLDCKIALIRARGRADGK